MQVANLVQPMQSPSPRVVIIVENLPVPFDRRVWSEATTLRENGFDVSVICPKGYGGEEYFEILQGIKIYRHWLPEEGRGPLGYLREYSVALILEFVLSLRIFFSDGFDVIHICNPPDLMFLVAGFYKWVFGKRVIFDHHDINPELYEAKFGRRDFLWRMMILLERLTFRIADVTIATNESYRRIAIERGHKRPDRVFIVRSGPNLTRVKEYPPEKSWKRSRNFLVAYVGVIGQQEGLDLLVESITHIVNKRNRNDVQFVVMGNGPELDNIKRLASKMAMEDYITFTGRVDDQTLFTILSTADVCVNPDRPTPMNDKSTMNKIMEYMALGKPVVQFDLTEGRYSALEASLYAKNNDCADFGDMILELLDAPSKRKVMGEVGKARVQNELEWKWQIPALLAAYRCALKMSK